jgi:hypothetical protein
VLSVFESLRLALARAEPVESLLRKTFAIRRAAIRENYCADVFVLARKALEAAIRDESDLLAMLPPSVETTRRRLAPGTLATRSAGLRGDVRRCGGTIRPRLYLFGR